MTASILVVDDDPVQRRLLETALAKSDHDVVVADSGEVGLKALEARGDDIGAVVLDLKMPGMGGLGMLEAMRERGLEHPVVVLTAQGGIDTVVSAMRAGAFDFVVKPVSPEKLVATVSGALKVEQRGTAAKQKQAKVSSSHAMTFDDLIAASPVMERVLRLGRKAAASNIPILIEGESGVGKEMVARAIQGGGGRRGKPFVPVNCGAIPDNLVESILFGHEKGAFTGATEKHVGKFVEANSGTLFLDEIGDLPLDVQVKLLRAVQEGEVDAVGARAPIRVDIRLISATHRDLIQRVKDGLFREDLYYRLNVFPIHVPPLRERPEDIPLLTQHFIRRLGKSETGGRVKGIAANALAMLEAYDWPGNIRQLENAVFRAVVLCDGEVLTADDFPQIRAQTGTIQLSTKTVPVRLDNIAAAAPAAASLPATPPDTMFSDEAGSVRALDDKGNVRALADVESEMIRLAVEHYGGQMSEVARRLGIGRSTLYRKLKELGIDPDTGRAIKLAS
ncbi:sigma-54 dependent transcriptional regulator [Mesorhizobium sp. Z1-4]|uniref:sigma-54-dependent transcriptional regulator n=1 Tax=Mesorhizobium sp. Z1-4 TaxID=2448478 RepID=UPI000FD81DD0|nr:sigma-54 dependent transcriptional regulator [Mesorhizobium sp. Z1-4]